MSATIPSASDVDNRNPTTIASTVTTTEATAAASTSGGGGVSQITLNATVDMQVVAIERALAPLSAGERAVALQRVLCRAPPRHAQYLLTVLNAAAEARAVGMADAIRLANDSSHIRSLPTGPQRGAGAAATLLGTVALLRTNNAAAAAEYPSRIAECVSHAAAAGYEPGRPNPIFDACLDLLLLCQSHPAFGSVPRQTFSNLLRSLETMRISSVAAATGTTGVGGSPPGGEAATTAATETTTTPIIATTAVSVVSPALATATVLPDVAAAVSDASTNANAHGLDLSTIPPTPATATATAAVQKSSPSSTPTVSGNTNDSRSSSGNAWTRGPPTIAQQQPAQQQQQQQQQQYISTTAEVVGGMGVSEASRETVGTRTLSLSKRRPNLQPQRAAPPLPAGGESMVSPPAAFLDATAAASSHHSGAARFSKEEFERVKRWLKQLRLHKYYNVFERMNYTEMAAMTHEELERYGITARGARTKMLKSIQQLRECNEVAAARTARVRSDAAAGRFRAAITELRALLKAPAHAGNMTIGFSDDYFVTLSAVVDSLQAHYTDAFNVSSIGSDAQAMAGVIQTARQSEAFTATQQAEMAACQRICEELQLSPRDSVPRRFSAPLPHMGPNFGTSSHTKAAGGGGGTDGMGGIAVVDFGIDNGGGGGSGGGGDGGTYVGEGGGRSVGAWGPTNALANEFIPGATTASTATPTTSVGVVGGGSSSSVVGAAMAVSAVEIRHRSATARGEISRQTPGGGTVRQQQQPSQRPLSLDFSRSSADTYGGLNNDYFFMDRPSSTDNLYAAPPSGFRRASSDSLFGSQSYDGSGSLNSLISESPWGSVPSSSSSSHLPATSVTSGGVSKVVVGNKHGAVSAAIAAPGAPGAAGAGSAWHNAASAVPAAGDHFNAAQQSAMDALSARMAEHALGSSSSGDATNGRSTVVGSHNQLNL